MSGAPARHTARIATFAAGVSTFAAFATFD